MNIRKHIDYSQMYVALDALLDSVQVQTKLFCEIGRVIDERPEKGAAVAAAEYIGANYPEKSGFSPRGLRRMRDFYRAYKNDPALMAEAMNVSWTLNALVIENCEDQEVRRWYIRACIKLGWSKQELSSKIAEKAHEDTELDIAGHACYTKNKNIPMMDNKSVLRNEIESVVISLCLLIPTLVYKWLHRQAVHRIGKWRQQRRYLLCVICSSFPNALIGVPCCISPHKRM